MRHNYNLGSHKRKIKTAVKETEEWFNRGLLWIYGFDLEMAQRCFQQAVKSDDACAMAYWGLAYSSGIYYNKPWHRMEKDELADKLQKTHTAADAALARIDQARESDQMMIEALGSRSKSVEK